MEEKKREKESLKSHLILLKSLKRLAESSKVTSSLEASTHSFWVRKEAPQPSYSGELL